VLGELRDAMQALIAHSPRAIDELKDKFDAGWLRQQAEHGALETESVLALCRYLAETIAAWQAPEDDAPTARWLATVEETMAASAQMELSAFICAHLMPFLKGATERLGQVYTRTLDFLAEREAAQREMAQPDGTSASELEQQD
jgi:hypothetical protein